MIINAEKGTLRMFVRGLDTLDVIGYSMISSARASREFGTVSPSAFAVLRLMAISSLVTCCTGKSVGFVPPRMRPA